MRVFPCQAPLDLTMSGSEEEQKLGKKEISVSFPLFRGSDLPIFALMLPVASEPAASCAHVIRLTGLLLESVDICEDLGDSTIKVLRDCLIHIDRFIQ